MAAGLMTRGIAGLGWAARAFGVAGLVAAGTPAVAQAPGLVEIGIEAKADLYGANLEIAGCSEYLGVALTGREFVFLCESRPVYEVRVNGRTTWFGYQRLRDLAPRFGTELAPPLPGPVRVMRLLPAMDQAVDAFNRLAALDRPQDLPSRADDGPAATAAAAPAESVTPGPDAPRLLRLISPASLGPIRAMVGTLTPLQAPGGGAGLARWEWRLPADNRDATLRLVVADRPACSVDLAAAGLETGRDAVIDPPCAAHALALPAGFRAAGPGCRPAREGGSRCILLRGEREVEITSEAWGSAVARLDEAGVLRVSAGALRPALPIVSAALGGVTTGRCAAPAVTARLLGYCSEAGCEPVPGAEGIPIGGLGATATPGPSLSAAAWPEARGLPTGAKIAIQAEGREPEVIDLLFGGPVIDVLARLGLSAPTERLPLDLRLTEGGFAPGRELRVFADDGCTVPFEDATKSLVFAGTTTPEVPACGHFQIFDGARKRSSCAPLRVEEARAVAEAELVACGDKRLVLVVVENASLSGRIGQEIEDALETLIRSAHAEGACLPIDLVRAIGPDRKVLLSGEDLKLAAAPERLLEEVRFGFLNSESQPFDDFSWIERGWGSELGGIVLFLDATQPEPATALDAPAAVLWFANGVFRWVFNAAGETGCAGYRDIFRMENCEGIGESFGAERLREIVELGLAEIRDAE